MKRLSISLLLSVSVCSFSAWASGVRGKVAYFKGTVTVGSRGAASGEQVREGETVKTGAESVAIIALGEGSRVKLNADSEITLGTGKDPGDDEIRLNSGGIFSEVKKEKVRHFYVRTKSATLGVRGTRFFTAYGKEGKHGDDVWMCVSEGEVAIETSAGADARTDGRKNPVIVKTGEGVFIPSGKEPTPPKPYEWTRGLNWNMDPASGEVQDHSSMESRYHDLKKQNYD